MTLRCTTKQKHPRLWDLDTVVAVLDCYILEIVQERLSREFDLDLITTAPSVVYRLHMINGDRLNLHNPADYPDVTLIKSVEEPWIRATILVPDEYLGPILDLCGAPR